MRRFTRLFIGGHFRLNVWSEAIESVRNGLQVLVSALRQDPYALETAYLSIITFDSSTPNHPTHRIDEFPNA